MLDKKGVNRFFARNKMLMAAMTLMGTVVGAGILGIPYVVAKAGFLLGLIIIVTLGLAFLMINLFVGEFVLRTKEQHQLTGYAEKYLGKWGKRVMTFTMVFGIYGALTAYLIGEGEALRTIFGFGPPLMYSLFFFIVTFIIIYSGMKATGKVELVMVFLLLLIVAFIGIFSFQQINCSYLSGFDWTKLFIPYGVIVFAFLGAAAIPEMQEVLGKNKKLMKKSIVIGSTVPIVLYILFCFFVVGVVGLNDFELLAPNERIATIALGMYSSPLMSLFANFIAVIAMFTSYLTLAVALTEMFQYDYHYSHRIALSLTLILPLLILLFHLTNFITVLGITGALAGGLEGILLVLIFWKSKLLGDRKPEYSLGKHKLLGTILILMFVLGVVYSFL